MRALAGWSLFTCCTASINHFFDNYVVHEFCIKYYNRGQSLQSLELWNMSENKTMTLSAHEGLIDGLAVSTVTGLVASASHDKCVKLWK